MATTGIVVHNLLYCVRSGCRRSLLLEGLGCWTKLAAEWNLVKKSKSDSNESDVVETFVECDACKTRRLIDGLDGPENIEGSVVNTDWVLSDKPFREVVKNVNGMIADVSVWRTIIKEDEGDEDFIAVDYRRAHKKKLLFPVVSMEQVLKGLRETCTVFKVHVMDGRGSSIREKNSVIDEVEDFVGEDEAWKSLLLLEYDFDGVEW
jgi:hypothetical protein